MTVAMEFLGDFSVSEHFGARCVLVVDDDNRDRVLCVVKASYSAPFSGAPEILPGEPVRDQQVRHAESARASVRLPSDLAPHKPGTEVLLVGHARRPVAFADARWVDVTLAVRDGERPLLEKSLRVYGPRVWERAGDAVIPGAPQHVVDTPLSWEWAWGGGDGERFEARNPVGRGWARDPLALIGQPCHRIEPIVEGGPRAPVGFGPIAAHWEPRRTRRGAGGEDWATSQAPKAPRDRDPRYHCVAPDDQWLARPLTGRERFVISGVHPSLVWDVQLPPLEPEIQASVAGRVETLSTHLDTVLFDADEERVELVWRASFKPSLHFAAGAAVSVRPRARQLRERLVA